MEARKTERLGPLMGGKNGRHLMGGAKDKTLGHLVGGQTERPLMRDAEDRTVRTPHGREKREAPNGRPERQNG
jgi:hypothetical protein